MCRELDGRVFVYFLLAPLPKEHLDFCTLKTDVQAAQTGRFQCQMADLGQHRTYPRSPGSRAGQQPLVVADNFVRDRSLRQDTQPVATVP